MACVRKHEVIRDTWMSPPSHSAVSGAHCHGAVGSGGRGRGDVTEDASYVLLGRMPYLLDQGAQMQRGEGRLLGRLHHDRVPAAERGRQLPGQHQEGEVPLQRSTEERGGLSWVPTHAPRGDAGLARARLGASGGIGPLRPLRGTHSIAPIYRWGWGGGG